METKETIEKHKMTECYFTHKKGTSSATICNNCGQEKFLHTIGKGIKVSTYIVNPKEEPKQVGEYQQELFNYLHDLGVIALESELQEIERIVLKMQSERMYSEEEARAIWSAGQEYWRTSGDSITFEELTKQFKKK